MKKVLETILAVVLFGALGLMIMYFMIGGQI